MQPNEIVPTNPTQQPPDKFDFMLKEQPKPKWRFRLPLPNLPKPVLISLGAVFGLIFIIILASLIFGGSNSGNDKLIKVMAQAQEIVRVSDIAQQQAQDSQSSIINLTSTTSIILTSQQTQLTKYLKNNHIKVAASKLASYLNKNVDTQLQNATQNNSLDSTYANYLKNQLSGYQAALQTAYKSAGQNGKALLADDFSSIQTLLTAPQFSAAQTN